MTVFHRIVVRGKREYSVASSLLLLLDDIASVLDDVAALTKVATKKTAGVLGDDLAHLRPDIPLWVVRPGRTVLLLLRLNRRLDLLPLDRVAGVDVALDDDDREGEDP